MVDGKSQAQATWGASPTGSTSAPGHMPGTREFFERAVKFRDHEEQPWLADVVPFNCTKGMAVLEIGSGPGYDALKFMQAGADYTGLDLTPENIDRAKQHLSFYGLTPNVMQGDAENLPFSDASFDVVYSNGVLHHVPDISRAFREARRVLKPGGKAYILVYNRNSAFYMFSVVMLHVLTGGFLRETLKRRRARIEFTVADGADPLVNVYSKGEFSRLLAEAGLQVDKVVARKFVKEDLPGASKLGKLYGIVPKAGYNALAPLLGWYLVASATKP